MGGLHLKIGDVRGDAVMIGDAEMRCDNKSGRKLHRWRCKCGVEFEAFCPAKPFVCRHNEPTPHKANSRGSKPLKTDLPKDSPCRKCPYENRDVYGCTKFKACRLWRTWYSATWHDIQAAGRLLQAERKQHERSADKCR